MSANGVAVEETEDALGSVEEVLAKGPWVDKKVAVLCGGESDEREISLKTGKAMHWALLTLGYEARIVDVSPEGLRSLMEEPPDVVVIAMHGGQGENGSIQGFLECLGIPYTGPGVHCSALSMNKASAKTIWAKAGLPTPEWKLISRESAREMLDGEGLELPLPCVVKPACGGSSGGVSLVKRQMHAKKALRKALRNPGPVIVEGYLQGRELSVALMDGHVMGIVEIVPIGGFYDYNAKYDSDSGTEYLIPAPLTSRLQVKIAEIATEATRILEARGVVRVDMFVDESDLPWLLELNTLPGMTETSLVPKLAAQTGLSFETFVEMILNRASLDAECEKA